MLRVVEPEIIDQLPPDHPDVIRSRRDLKVINFLMGNERWITRKIAEFPSARNKGVLEIGAGEGTLLDRLAKKYPDIPLTACDLAPRPPGLQGQIKWDQRDVFESLSSSPGGILAANLFLHHFEYEELERFRPHMEKFDVICINEPYRTQQTLMDAKFMLPFVGRATKHDMIVSIKAGFLPGELPERLGLDSSRWKLSEETSWRGGLRVLACRA
ncbi:class I SAM-dependent methyltransferase [Luteolibacter luteus]|uniref:Class I SAM-dependent methyltransferase n=1 Tax=Luteolibacter luteus TaxID=2728835 RepID=A0A858RDT8_9BACT|nr:class I SAM-dependent methyltransferase [Luteolibacter luteus]QJE94967.1 class I SAM-dependent methyltransferase [Luteolibacter luteus]